MAQSQGGRNQQQIYSFALKSIDIIEKTLRIHNKGDKKIDYDFAISLQIFPSPPDNQSFHIMSVSVFEKGVEKEILAAIRLGFIFEISDLEDIADQTEQGITLPGNLLNLLNAVVIGTMRGVLYSELRGTQLDGAILPVLDPSKFQREASV